MLHATLGAGAAVPDSVDAGIPIVCSSELRHAVRACAALQIGAVQLWHSAMDIPERLRSVLAVEPRSIYEAFDDRRGLVAAFRGNQTDAIGEAVIEHANQVHLALSSLARDCEQDQRIVA